MEKQCMKKIISALFCVLFITFYPVACQKDGNDETQTLQETQTAQENIETEAKVTDELPDGLDYEGYSFNILTYNGGNTGYYAHYYVPNIEDASVVSDAAFKRNQAVEDRLNCLIACEEHSDSSGKGVVKLIEQSVMSGDDIYDIGEIHIADTIASLFASGYLYNYRNMDYINFEKPYYTQNFNELFNINSKQYVLSGSFVNAGNMPLFIYFNKDMMANLGRETPYDIVFEGNWTFVKYMEYCTNVYSDIDGKEGATSGDMYASADITYVYSYFMSGFNINTVTEDDNGELMPYLYDEKIYKALEMLNDLYWNNESVTHTNASFSGGNVLFFTNLSAHDAMREIDTFDFGILPFPKYDDNQENYVGYTPVSYSVTPAIIGDPERTGAILEALNAGSYSTTRPAFVEVYIQQKILRDDSSIEVYNMLCENQFIEFTRYMNFSPELEGYEFIRRLINSGSNDIASWAAANQIKLDALFNDYYGYFFD